MPEIDLNQKVWGVKGKTHILVFAAIYIMASSLVLLALVDLMQLPPKVDNDVKGIAYYKAADIFISIGVAFFLLLIIFCLKIKVVYVILAVVLIIYSALVIFNTLINLVMPTSILPSFFEDQIKMIKKYYKYWNIGYFLSQIFASLAKIYLGVVLLKMTVWAPRQQVVVVHANRSISEQRTGADDEEDDVEDKPRSGKKKKEVVVVEKSGKSGKTGDSGNSGNSGQLDKTGQSGKSGGDP